MVERLLQWLNGNRKNYGAGVALYCAYGKDMRLKHVFLQGKNPFNESRLVKELQELAGVSEPAAQTAPTLTRPSLPPSPKGESVRVRPEEPSTQAPALLAAATHEAHTAWKELMNQRALLFGLCRKVDDWEDENDPQRVIMRGKLALEILTFNRKVVMPAYDKLDYVREHGKLPPVHADVTQDVDEDYANLPDHKVKQTIDNLRKNLSKLRKREQTPERVAIITNHELSLQKLLVRWDYLK